MNREQYTLPPGVNLPARYKKTINSRRLFSEGAQDGSAGRPIGPELDSSLRQQGKAAWEAYHEGHAEGMKVRAVTRKPRGKTT